MKTILWWIPVFVLAAIAYVLGTAGIGLDDWQFWAVLGLCVLLRAADAAREGARYG